MIKFQKRLMSSLVFFSPFSVAITSLGEERAKLICFCTFVDLLLSVSSSFGVWEGLWLVNIGTPWTFL